MATPVYTRFIPPLTLNTYSIYTRYILHRTREILDIYSIYTRYVLDIYYHGREDILNLYSIMDAPDTGSILDLYPISTPKHSIYRVYIEYIYTTLREYISSINRGVTSSIYYQLRFTMVDTAADSLEAPPGDHGLAAVMHINRELRAEIEMLRHRQQERDQRNAQGRGYPSGYPSALRPLADPLRDRVDADP